MADTRISTTWGFVLPAVVVVAVCFLLPVANILRLSFVEPSVGIGNYVELARGSLYQSIAATTLRMALLTTLISVVMGYIVAFAIAHADPRQRDWLLLAVLMPFWLSVLVRAFAWVVLLQREGVVNSALMKLAPSTNARKASR